MGDARQEMRFSCGPALILSAPCKPPQHKSKRMLPDFYEATQKASPDGVPQNPGDWLMRLCKRLKTLSFTIN
jgi:hypothetical protein